MFLPIFSNIESKESLGGLFGFVNMSAEKYSMNKYINTIIYDNKKNKRRENNVIIIIIIIIYTCSLLHKELLN